MEETYLADIECSSSSHHANEKRKTFSSRSSTTTTSTSTSTTSSSGVEESLAVRRVRLAAGLRRSCEEGTGSGQEDEDEEAATTGAHDSPAASAVAVAGSFREEALKEKCGVFGVISNGDWPTSLDVAHIICLGLVGLQHRGQESAGIVTCKYKSEPLNVCRAEGLVSSAFNEMSMMTLKGNLGIGHTRYSTTGGSGSLQLAQPFVVHTKYGTIAVAHNGELVNSNNLRQTLLSFGVGLSTGGDSELITQCLSQTPPEEFLHRKFQKKRTRPDESSNGAGAGAGGGGGGQVRINEKESSLSAADQLSKCNNHWTPVWKADPNLDENNITSRLLYLMSQTSVSYSLLVMYNECIYAVRDPFGNRPLTFGMLTPPPNAGDIGSIPFSVIDNCFIDGWCISSESCPFPSVHAQLKRDVEPGEILKFERNKMPKTIAVMPRPAEAISPAFCIFEYVYFARPDSIMERQTVYTVRRRCGERLAIESPVIKGGSAEERSNYIVAPVPESSIPAALGYSHQSGIPYVEVFCKNRYVGRTFIQPSTRLRRLGVAKKFGPLMENFQGKSIILIDDSIVRGTTIGQLVRLLREAGAKDVHIRIASPALHFPCYMGINIPTKEELIANHLSADQLALTLGAASLKYLSVEGLKNSVQSGIREMLKLDKSKVSVPDDYNSNILNATTTIKTHGSPVVVAGQQVERRPPEAQANGLAGQPEEEEEDEFCERIGHCDACLTGNYPVKLDEETF